MENLEMTFYNGIYKNRRVLITGHNGFKGSWLTYWLAKMGAKVYGLSLKEKRIHYDCLKLKAKSYFGDINNIVFVRKVINTINPEIIFHLAAQSLVSESFKNALHTFHTNVIGTLNVLECVRKNNNIKAILIATTDKVYQCKGNKKNYKESDPLGGYDPYSSSKACVEILSQSYVSSFFNQSASVLLSTARSGNVIGGGDWAKNRLIPDLVRSIIENKTALIRKPNALRPWQHVLDSLSGYLLLGQKLLEGKKEFATSWNLGPVNSLPVSVSNVLNKMKLEWPALNFRFNSKKEYDFHESDFLLLNCDKAYHKLHWQPVWNIDETIHRTANWYRLFLEKNIISTAKDLEYYLSNAKEKKVSWCR